MSKVGSNNDRVRLEWIQKKISSLPKGLKILDAGAGELANKKNCTHLNYVSQDFCQYNGEGDSTALQTQEWDTSKIDIVSDITSIPVENESFDVIICTEVLEHLPDPILALKEFHRILKNNGELIITAPFCSLTHFAPYHFYSGFNKYFYTHHLSNLNFDILEITPNGNFFEYIAQELRRTKNISKRYSRPIASFILKSILKVNLYIFNKFNTHDKGSSEVLCYGYFVHARKNDNLKN
ncbi:MAG: class I SAM-dependent methyltransferase [Campylobacterales bacterium]